MESLWRVLGRVIKLFFLRVKDNFGCRVENGLLEGKYEEGILIIVFFFIVVKVMV